MQETEERKEVRAGDSVTDLETGITLYVYNVEGETLTVASQHMPQLTYKCHRSEVGNPW